MTRPQDWYPLAETDPVPGDPVKVTAAETHYRDIANRIRSAAANLLSVMNAANDTSDAVAAFRDKAADVRIGILKAETRYEGLADALGAYAPLLATAQSKSVVALRNAQEAHGEAWSARNNEAYLQDRIRQTIDPFEAAELSRDVGFQRSRAEQADADLASARSLLDQAITERDDAAKAAIQQIDDVEAVSPVRDQWHDKVRDWAGRIADQVAAWAEEIGKILDKYTWVILALQVAIIVVSFVVPGVGAVAAAIRVVAGVVRALTYVAKAVKWAAGVALVVRFVTGRTSLDEVVRKGVGAAVAALASVALGKLVSFVTGKIGYAGFRHAAKSLHTSEKMRIVRQGLKDPSGRADTWASRALADHSAGALESLRSRSTDYGRAAIKEGLELMTKETQITDYVVDGASDRVGDAVTSKAGSPEPAAHASTGGRL